MNMTVCKEVPYGRSYKYFTKTPLWPFGYGLSYTNFEISMDKVELSSSLPQKVTVSVKNTGKFDGAEVV